MSRSCDKLVEKAGGEGASGGLGSYSKSTGTGMDDGTGFIFYVNNFSAKVPFQVSAFRFHHQQNSFLKLNLHTSKILKS